MSLDSSLSIAVSGLDAVSNALGVIGQNVANASTADWVTETPAQESISAGGGGEGVATLPTQRQLNLAVQTGVFAQNTAVAGLQTQQTALSAIDSVQGVVGSGTDLSSLLGKLQDAFTTLENDPSEQTQLEAVVGAATAVTQQINALANAVEQARQNAQNAAVSGIDTINAALTQVGALNTEIVALQAQGRSTADLDNQRDNLVDQIGQQIPVKQLAQTNGSVVLITTDGLTLPTLPNSPRLTLASATLGPSITYPASAAVPEVLLGGVDVTSLLGTTGNLGANLALRDSTLPSFQAGLDEFSYTLASRFDQQGLTLFTDNSGNMPTATGPDTQSGYVGFAQTITVNPAVIADPSLVRDGTHDVTGSATGPSAFTVNPPDGPAGFTGMIDRVLDYALTDQVQSGVAQTSPAATGLGPAGDQSAGFTPANDLGDFAAGLVGAMSETANAAGSNLTAAQALQSALQARLNVDSGVSIDTEMSTMVELQNAYGANAKVINAVQTMWTALLATVQ
jgi:flagellar hook-associated protein 1 FlgK